MSSLVHAIPPLASVDKPGPGAHLCPVLHSPPPLFPLSLFPTASLPVALLKEDGTGAGHTAYH